MTEQHLTSLVNEWDLSAPPENEAQPDELAPAPPFGALHRELCWFGQNLWSRYLPALHHGCNPSYSARLAEWVGNTEAEQDRKLLLMYASYITFLSHEDMDALHRAAFDGPVTRWVIDQAGLRMTDLNFQARLRNEIHRRTWFCPVTDSMDINEFYHINHLTGISHRPAFSTLAMLGDKATPEVGTHFAERLRSFIASPDPRTKAPSIRRLVLLEDFVGSGTQAQKAVSWAAKTIDIPILFVPLLICPTGYHAFTTLAAKHPGKLFFDPVLCLKERDLLGPTRNMRPGFRIAERIETFASNNFERVAGGPHHDRKKAPYTAFGWEQTGCSVVSYSNTPNNTLPVVHHHPATGQWKPLFPRAARE